MKLKLNLFFIKAVLFHTDACRKMNYMNWDRFFTRSPSPEEEKSLRADGDGEKSVFISLTAESNACKRELAVHGIKHEDKYFALLLAAKRCLGFKVYRFCLKPEEKNRNPSVVDQKGSTITPGNIKI